SVVCGVCCFCLGIYSLYIVYTYKVFGGETLKTVKELNTYKKLEHDIKLAETGNNFCNHCVSNS
ncbi:MAG: hypothetical protein LBC03_03180, partial [Nitrososphaerota archaeon]|nr:hypothetical protein [Nitrososphaerota archaeon]